MRNRALCRLTPPVALCRKNMEYWIEEFGIRPQMQGNGIGSRFMQEIEKDLIKRGITHIVLLTGKSVSAYCFYQKNGFEEKKEYIFLAKSLN